MSVEGQLKKAKERWGNVSNTFCPKLNMDDIVSPSLLQDYLKQGWGAITKNYKEKNMPVSPGKQRKLKTNTSHFDNLNIEQKKLALEILGSVRKYLVEQIFNCQGKSGKNEYFAAGSTNITSDYDVAITGPNANEIMWGMFKKFIQQYGDALPYAFDSNLYSSPLYIHKTHKGEVLSKVRKASKSFPRVDYNKRNFTLVPQTSEEIKEELAWAGLKLLRYKPTIVDLKLKNLEKILEDSEKLQFYLKKICDETLISGENNELESFIKALKKDESKKIVKNYYLQWRSQKVCQDYVYNNKKLQPIEKIAGEDKKNIFFYSNKANYFSSEAYYTSSAVNAIVVENQLKTKLNYGSRSNDIKKKVYLVAAIENLGDMLNHMSHEKGNLKNTIIKYSKYLYRIYLCLSNTGAGSAQWTMKALKLKKKVIPYRKTYDIKEADKEKIWIDVFYDGKMDKEKYLQKLKEILLRDIEKIFNSSSNSSSNLTNLRKIKSFAGGNFKLYKKRKSKKRKSKKRKGKKRKGKKTRKK